MKVSLRRAPRVATAEAVAVRPPILPGYRPWEAGGILARHRRKWLTALFILSFFYVALFMLMPRAMSISMSAPVVAIWLMIVWALPVREYRPIGAMAVCWWCYFVALFVWPNYLAISIPGLPWITIARLFCGPMVAMLLIQVSNCGPFRREMKELLGPSRTVVIMLAWFSVIQFLSIPISPTPIDTLNRVINNQIIWTAVFFVSVWVFRDVSKIERWGLTYVGFAALLCVVAYAEYRNGAVLWADSIPSFLKIDDESVQRLLAGAYRLGGVYRVVATNTTPLGLAEILGAATPFVLYAMVQYKHLAVRLALIGIDILLVYGILLTDSRLGLVSMIVGHAAYLLYISFRIYRFHPISVVRTLPVVIYPAIVALMISSVLFVGRIRNEVIGDGRQAYSDAARGVQFDLAMVKIWKSPIVGFGTGKGGPELGYVNPAGTLTIDSYYLSILLDHGFVGFFLYYGMIIVAMIKAAKISMGGLTKEHHLSAALAIYLLAFLATKAVLSQSANHPLMFMTLGGVVALTYRFQAKDLTESRKTL